MKKASPCWIRLESLERDLSIMSTIRRCRPEASSSHLWIYMPFSLDRLVPPRMRRCSRTLPVSGQWLFVGAVSHVQRLKHHLAHDGLEWLAKDSTTNC